MPRVSRNKHLIQTLTSQLHRETIMHETLQLLFAGSRRQVCARTSPESDEVYQRKTKDRADGMRRKVPIPLYGMCVCVCVCVCMCVSE